MLSMQSEQQFKYQAKPPFILSNPCNQDFPVFLLSVKWKLLLPMNLL